MAHAKEYRVTSKPRGKPAHPGDILCQDVLPALDMSVAEAAEALKVSRRTLHRILAGTTPVSPEMAVRLGKFCGNGPELWLRMQAAFDLWHAEKRLRTEVKRIHTRKAPLHRSSALQPASRDEFVYHYTSLQTALEHIIPTMSIRFGKYTHTNDPRETKQWLREHFVGTVPRTVPPEQSWNYLGPASDRIRPFADQLRILCTTEDSGQPGDDPSELRGFGLSRMWAQYSDNQRGVCLAFKRENLERSIDCFNIDGRLLKNKVHYDVLLRNYELTGGARAYEFTATDPDFDFTQHTIKHQQKLLFTKSLDWQGEREYRWVYIAKPEECESYVDIRGSLAAIFLGVDFPRTYLAVLSTPCRRFNIDVFQMHIYRDHLDCPELIDLNGLNPAA